METTTKCPPAAGPCFCIFELDDETGEAQYAHFYCSDECRAKAFPDFVGGNTKVSMGDGPCIRGTICQTCEKEIQGSMMEEFRDFTHNHAMLPRQRELLKWAEATIDAMGNALAGIVKSAEFARPDSDAFVSAAAIDQAIAALLLADQTAVQPLK